MERKKNRGAYIALYVLVLVGLLLLIRSCAPQDIDSMLNENGIHSDQVMVCNPHRFTNSSGFVSEYYC